MITAYNNIIKIQEQRIDMIGKLIEINKQIAAIWYHTATLDLVPLLYHVAGGVRLDEDVCPARMEHLKLKLKNKIGIFVVGEFAGALNCEQIKENS